MSPAGDTLIIGSAAVTIVLAVTGTIGFLGRKAWRAIRRLTLFLDDYEGTPARPGVESRPGVMERLQQHTGLLAQHTEVLEVVRADVAQVLGEMPKNGVPLATKIDALWHKHLADLSAAQAVAAAQTTVVVQPAVAPAPAAEPAAVEGGSE
jgi:hypothetical protein